MRSTILCDYCSSCVIFLAFPTLPDSVDRARIVSRRGVLFSFYFQENSCPDRKYLFVHIDMHQSECTCARNWVVELVALFPCAY